MTLAQQYHNEGLQKGRQEVVLETLEIRFGLVPQGVAEALRGIQGEGHLRRHHGTAMRCES